MGIDEYRKMLAGNSVSTIQSLDAHPEENGNSIFFTTTLSEFPDPKKEAEKKGTCRKTGRNTGKAFGKGAPGHSTALQMS